MENLDFAGDALAPPVNTGPVIELARDMVKRQLAIERAETALAMAKAELFKIETETMPDLMRSCGVTSLDLTSGWVLGLKPVFRASLPSRSSIEKLPEDDAAVALQRLDAGLRWLTRHKSGDIIKNSIKVELGMRQNALAKQVMGFLKKLKVSATRSQGVHPGTLTKLLREKVEAGVEVPFDVFAVFSGEVAEVKGPKK